MAPETELATKRALPRRFPEVFPAAADRQLRIGYLVQQFPPEVGAGPARVMEMARHWRDRGADITVITGMPNRPEGRIHPEYRGHLMRVEEVEGIRVLRSWLFASPKGGLGRTLANNLTFMATSALHGIVRARHLDVLIASSPPFFVHLAAQPLSVVGRVPLVLEVRDLWPDYLVGMGILRGRAAPAALFALERFLLKRAREVVVVTDTFRERVIEKGVAPDRISVVPNGVDTTFYRPGAITVPPIPEIRKRTEREFIVGYLGNFGVGQDLGSVLDAAALLAEEAPEIRIVLTGDGVERGRVEAHGAARNGNVHLTPPVPKAVTPAFHASCDACLVPLAPYPILQTTVPSKLFEILAMERPVIASLGGEGRTIVERSRAGIVAAPGNPRAIADAILRMRSLDPAERAAMGRRGRAFVAANYSREALAERYLALLGRIAAR